MVGGNHHSVCPLPPYQRVLLKDREEQTVTEISILCSRACGVSESGPGVSDAKTTEWKEKVSGCVSRLDKPDGQGGRTLESTDDPLAGSRRRCESSF